MRSLMTTLRRSAIFHPERYKVFGQRINFKEHSYAGLAIRAQEAKDVSGWLNEWLNEIGFYALKYQPIAVPPREDVILQVDRSTLPPGRDGNPRKDIADYAEKWVEIVFSQINKEAFEASENFGVLQAAIDHEDSDHKR